MTLVGNLPNGCHKIPCFFYVFVCVFYVWRDLRIPVYTLNFCLSSNSLT